MREYREVGPRNDGAAAFWIVRRRPERLRPVEGQGAEKIAKLVIDGTVNYGDSVLLIGKAGNVPLRDGRRSALRP
jgi:hypothetical protein